MILPESEATVIAPSDPRYDAARAVYNGAVDRYPLAIVQVADVADVLAAWRTPRARAAARHPGRWSSTVAVLGCWTTPSSSTSAGCVVHQLTRWPVRSGSMAVASGAMLIMPLARSAWRCRQVSCPPPGLPG